MSSLPNSNTGGSRLIFSVPFSYIYLASFTGWFSSYLLCTLFLLFSFCFFLGFLAREEIRVYIYIVYIHIYIVYIYIVCEYICIYNSRIIRIMHSTYHRYRLFMKDMEILHVASENLSDLLLTY